MLLLVLKNKNIPSDPEPEDIQAQFNFVVDENIELKIQRKIRDFVEFDEFDVFINTSRLDESEKQFMNLLKGYTIIK